MDKKNRKAQRCFLVFFLAALYAVPVTQAVVELKKSGRVQALDILADASVTPLRRADALNSRAAGLVLYADSIVEEINKSKDTAWSADKARQLADDALALLGDIKKDAYTINRHVKIDSTGGRFGEIDSLSLGISSLMQALGENAPAAGLAAQAAAMREGAKRLLAGYGRPSPFQAAFKLVNNGKYIFWNDRYLRPFEKEMENSSVFATAVRPGVLYARYVLFRDLGDKGVQGKAGWFFYKQDVDFLVKPDVLDPRSKVVDPNDKVISENPLSAIQRFRDRLADMGIDLLVVIVPGKPSIYPDLLSTRLRPENAGGFSHSLGMIRDLRREGIEAVDLFGPFARERLNDARQGDSLYLQKDTHWKARGVRLAARLVAERIKRYPWYRPGTTEYVIDSITIDREGDVAAMTTLPALKMHALARDFAPEKTKCYQVYRVLRDSTGKAGERALYKDEFHSSQILLLGDSFSRIYQTDEPRSAGWIAHLAYELSQPVASIVNDGGASTLVRQSLARRGNLLKGKKLVVWEIVERDFRFGEEGWKDVPLEAAR